MKCNTSKGMVGRTCPSQNGVEWLTTYLNNHITTITPATPHLAGIAARSTICQALLQYTYLNYYNVIHVNNSTVVDSEFTFILKSNFQPILGLFLGKSRTLVFSWQSLSIRRPSALWLHLFSHQLKILKTCMLYSLADHTRNVLTVENMKHFLCRFGYEGKK